MIWRHCLDRDIAFSKDQAITKFCSRQVSAAKSVGGAELGCCRDMLAIRSLDRQAEVYGRRVQEVLKVMVPS